MTTLTEAHATLRTWQQKLAEAKAELAEHSSRLGELALQNSSLVATQRLAELNVELTIAEQAVKTATQQVTALVGSASNDELIAVFRPATMKRLEMFKAQLAEHNRIAHEAGEKFESVKEVYEHSLNVIRSQAQMAMRAENDIIDIGIQMRDEAAKLRAEMASGATQKL